MHIITVLTIFRISFPFTAVCEPRCKFGECVGLNKCRCFPGYTGKTCSQGQYDTSILEQIPLQWVQGGNMV